MLNVHVFYQVKIHVSFNNMNVKQERAYKRLYLMHVCSRSSALEQLSAAVSFDGHIGAQESVIPAILYMHSCTCKKASHFLCAYLFESMQVEEIRCMEAGERFNGFCSNKAAIYE